MRQCVASMMLVGILVCRSSRCEEPTLLTRNGGWCWFQGERAVVVEGKVIFTSIAGDDYAGCDPGDLVATAYEPNSGVVTHFELHDKLQADDHDVAGLCVLDDKRLLAVYGKHGSDRLQRWRITEQPADISQWSDEASFELNSNYTYSNVYRLSTENERVYNFHRGLGFNPNCTISDDGGLTWRYGWRLMEWTREDLKNDPRYTGMDGTRPYVRYASNGRDTIHFLMTDDHPRAYDNSIYHGYFRNGKIHASDGGKLATLTEGGSSPLKPRDFTEVFRGSADRVAWTSDIRLDQNGNPYAAFSVQFDDAATRHQRQGGGLDHRYYYARWDGSTWRVHLLAYAGTKLYAGEDDYTGLVALDPNDVNCVVISTNADPNTGQPLISSSDGLRHWELFQGINTDDGASWMWTALTSNSTLDNLRPVIPEWPGGPRVILWPRGALRSYSDYHLDIVGLAQLR